MGKPVHICEGKVNRTLCGRSTDGLSVTITVQDLLRGTYPNLQGQVCKPCEKIARQKVAPVKQGDQAMPPIPRERIERAARLYSSNTYAAEALGIRPESFARLCRRYGILTPQQRKARPKQPDRIREDLGPYRASTEQDCYQGCRDSYGTVKVIRPDNTELKPDQSLKLVKHSPTGFAWGYKGSGPAQLALAILLDVGLSDEEALKHYQSFKEATIARLSWDNPHFAISVAFIMDWLSAPEPSFNLDAHLSRSKTKGLGNGRPELN